MNHRVVFSITKLKMSPLIQLAERGLLKDTLIRSGIRKLLEERLQSVTEEQRSAESWLEDLSTRSVAEDTDVANEQHYEIPAGYFNYALGKHLKYSSGLWDDSTTLDESEAEMLKLTCKRAELSSNQRILELGCGWGSLSLWMAANYPESKITAISNSASQKKYIDGEAKKRGLLNLEIITCDINKFEPNTTFDRIVSVEMFEHVRNHTELFKRLTNWLKSQGKVFVHVFAHKTSAYLFDAKSSKDWMSRYFFTGGIMPSADLLPAAAQALQEEKRWEVNGTHYGKTQEAWLAKHDSNKKQILKVFTEVYGRKYAKLWFQRWRMFYMACSELFSYADGKEWMVMHYRFTKSSEK